MYRSNLGFLDLPNEILLIILKKLDHMDVLYSLVDVDNRRLHMILKQMFSHTLNFVLTTASDDVVPMADSILDRFCISILPKIDSNVKFLILKSESMERILLAADYPNLTELKIFNFNEEVILRYFTDESPFRRIFQQQITDLILVYNSDIIIDYDALSKRKYPKGVHGYILKYFENLKHLSITGFGTLLSLRNFPSTTCSSSTLKKLCVYVSLFEDCLALLDGRLKQLTAFTVMMNCPEYGSSVVYNMDDLPNLKYLSLQCICSNDDYNIHIIPLLRRMSNLEELKLNIMNENRSTLVDGTQIKSEILVHLSQLRTFNFYIVTKTKLPYSHLDLSSEDIQRTFTNIGYEHVRCILTNIGRNVTCHVFSIPFVFSDLQFFGSAFPPIVFTHVTQLRVHDVVLFKHEFFVRIARFFPSLKELRVHNSHLQPSTSNKLDSDNNQLNFVIEYPHLISLCLEDAHIDHVELFLDKTKIHLPRLTKLTIDFDQLKISTENFTKETTRFNCAKVKKLFLNKILVHSKDFYDYFPLLSSCSHFDIWIH